MYLGKFKYYYFLSLVIPIFFNIYIANSRRTALIIKLFLLMFCLVLLNKSVLATNYYVNDGSTTGDVYCTVIGNNSNNGLTPSTPKADLSYFTQGGLATLNANDTIFIDAGTWTVSQLTFTKSGTSAGQVVFMGADTSKTIFTAASSTNIFYVQNNTIDITFSNLKFYQPSTSNGQILFKIEEGSGNNNIKVINCEFVDQSPNSDCIDVNGPYATIQNCTFFNRSQYAIQLNGNASYCTITGCTINIKNNANPNSSQGIYIQASTANSFLISNNKIIADNTGKNGIGIYNNPTGGGTIQNNYISGFENGIIVNNGTSCKIYFNSIFSRKYAIYSTNSLSGWDIRNNILAVSNAAGYPFYTNNATTPSTLNYNLYYSKGGTNLLYINGTSYTAVGVGSTICTSKIFECNGVTGDPQFIDTTNANLNLAGCSIAKNAGVTISGITTDIYNTTRSATPTIGAFEITTNGVTVNAGIPQSVCSGAPFTLGATLTATCGTAPYTYSWYSNPSGFISTIANPTASLTTTTTYTVSVTDKNGSTATSTVVITKTTVTAAPTVGSNSPVVVGDILNLTCSSTSSYSWVGPNSFSSTLQNPAITNVQSVNAGAYTVSITDAYGCTNTGTTTVVIRIPKKYYVNDVYTTGDVFCTAIGNDGNDGLSPATPKLTLASLLSTYVLGAKDTVFTDAGTYVTQQTFTGADEGAISGQLVFIGAGTNLTIFQASASDKNIFYIQNSSSTSYITFRDMQFYQPNISNGQDMVRIEGSNCKNIQLINCLFNNYATASSCIEAEGINTLISNCIFNNRSLSGIKVTKNGTDPTVTIDGCTINVKNNNTPGSSSAIDLNSTITTVCTISNNKIVGDATGKYGIYNENASNAVIKNNYISGFELGIYISGTTTIINGQCYFNSIFARKYALYANGLTGWDIRNNIFEVTNTGGNVFFDNDAAKLPTTQNYNLYYSLRSAVLFSYGGTTYTTTALLCSSAKAFECNAITGDPLYSDTTNALLDLASSSPAKAKGIAISGITTDIYKTSRIDPPTIGAYELLSVLPIELISFENKCHENVLMFLWSTATETNNNFFTIESSKDGENFEPIAIVQGAGNSNVVKNYSFIYDASTNGDLYCRLKQTDYNGQYSYSNIILQNNCNDTLNSSPKIISVNSDKGLIKVLFKSAIYKNFTIHVFSADGRLIANKTGVTNDHITNVQLPYYQSSSAVYMLSLQINNANISKKFFLKTNN